MSQSQKTKPTLCQITCHSARLRIVRQLIFSPKAKISCSFLHILFAYIIISSLFVTVRLKFYMNCIVIMNFGNTWLLKEYVLSMRAVIHKVD